MSSHGTVEMSVQVFGSSITAGIYYLSVILYRPAVSAWETLGIRMRPAVSAWETLGMRMVSSFYVLMKIAHNL